MYSPLQPPGGFSIATSKGMERLSLILDDGADSIHRVAALQLDDKVIVEQVYSCLFLIFLESGLEEGSEVGLR